MPLLLTIPIRVWYSAEYAFRSDIFDPTRLEPSDITSSIIIAWSLKKLSTFRAWEYFSALWISLAAIISGFIILDAEVISSMISFWLIYWLSLSLMIIFFAPSFLAIVDAMRFTSSDRVIAINKSQLETSASIKTSGSLPSPTMPITSLLAKSLSKTSLSWSITNISWPSSARPLVR